MVTTPHDSFVEILKGLTEGGRLSPLLWGLYIADLVCSFQRCFPDLNLPPTHLHIYIIIHLFVDDFCLVAYTPSNCSTPGSSLSSGAKSTVSHSSRTRPKGKHEVLNPVRIAGELR